MLDQPSKLHIDGLPSFELAFKEWYGGLCGYAYKYLGDHDEAEEIVQQVFVSYWERRESLSITVSLKSYLYRAVRNSCLNYIKHQKIKSAYFAVNEALRHEEEQAQADGLVSEELQQKITESIKSLPPERQKIFIMSRMDDMKYREIADKLGISAKTVEVQMGKALKTLREVLGEYLPTVLLALAVAVQLMKKYW